MIFAVWAPFLVPFLAAPAARKLADALHPRAAAWVLTTTTVALAAASTVSLGLLAVAGLLRIPLVAALGHLSLPWLSHASPAAELLAGPAAAALLAAVALALRTAHLQVRELRRARAAVAGSAIEDAPPTRAARLPLRVQLRRALRELVALDDHPLAVLDDDRADAYALPGRPGRIVVTAGMLRALPAPERAALLAHERAHLTCRHHLFLAAAAYAAVIHPALRQLRAPLGFHLERWADECAARAVGDRAVTARAVGRAALAAARAPRPARPFLAPAAAAGPVPRRVAALLSPHPGTGGRRRAAAALALAACLAVTATATLDATTDLHRSVETAQASAEHATHS
ncbi:Zn-dependent protease with chaperone function [Kitasatospora sp. MAA4]|uniref:M48 family metalloprotease n=1 Tax=Kitasatospora sp. MAA4 TaxID=3035093 RepID=UPI002475ADA2|nr:M48 family metalloprotease [Kitasatospora sp. MAA4]MDH6134449.1 Zn-dependent protease with chaperone function [Kitasatospora sp. MAA4]